MRIDPFQLFNDKSKGQGRIKFVLNENLKRELRRIVLTIRKKYGMLEISKYVGLPYYEFYRCMNGNKIPVQVTYKLLKLWSEITSFDFERKKINLISNVDYLTHGAGNTHKIIRMPKVSENLCKIAGAVVADGHLRHRKLKSDFFEYTIILRDQYKDNLDLFCEWLRKEFEINLDPVYEKAQNHWYVSFGNKIVFIILNKLFEIPFGKKSKDVKIPSILYNHSKLLKAFVTGVLMFDGGVDHRTGYFDLTSKSSTLINDVKNVLTSFGIEPDYVNDKIDPISGVCKLRLRNKKKLQKLLEKFIENDTTKWNQLNIHLNGLQTYTSLNELITKLNSIFPKVRSGITFEDVINLIYENGPLTTKQLQELTSRRKTVVNEYLKKLENWNALVTKKETVYKVWYINPNLKQNGGE